MRLKINYLVALRRDLHSTINVERPQISLADSWSYWGVKTGENVISLILSTKEGCIHPTMQWSGGEYRVGEYGEGGVKMEGVNWVRVNKGVKMEGTEYRGLEMDALPAGSMHQKTDGHQGGGGGGRYASYWDAFLLTMQGFDYIANLIYAKSSDAKNVKVK